MFTIHRMIYQKMSFDFLIQLNQDWKTFVILSFIYLKDFNGTKHRPQKLFQFSHRVEPELENIGFSSICSSECPPHFKELKVSPVEDFSMMNHLPKQIFRFNHADGPELESNSFSLQELERLFHSWSLISFR